MLSKGTDSRDITCTHLVRGYLADLRLSFVGLDHLGLDPSCDLSCGSAVVPGFR